MDVFHFQCKHSVEDEYCRRHCNPGSYPELLNADGSWFFNSSAAEQTNAWLGRYNPVLREMVVDKYNFFLDEMVMRKNWSTLHKLENEMPGHWVGVL